MRTSILVKLFPFLIFIGCSSTNPKQEQQELNVVTQRGDVSDISKSYSKSDIKNPLEDKADSLASLSYPILSTDLKPGRPSITVEGKNSKDENFKESILCKITNNRTVAISSTRFIYLLKDPIEEVEWIVKRKILPKQTERMNLSPEKDIKCNRKRFHSVYLVEAVLENGDFVTRENDDHRID